MLIFSVLFQIDRVPEGDFFKRDGRDGSLYTVGVTHAGVSAESARPLCDLAITALGKPTTL
jgi:hypothetical protein